jgi:hypothetical protein
MAADGVAFFGPHSYTFATQTNSARQGHSAGIRAGKDPWNCRINSDAGW